MYLQVKEQPMYRERGSTSSIFNDSSPRDASSTGNAARGAGNSSWTLLFEVKIGKGAALILTLKVRAIRGLLQML